MTAFSSDRQSHQHSLETLETLYQFDDFMASVRNVIDMGCNTGLDMEWWATRTTRDAQPRPLNIRCTGIDQLASCAAAYRHKYISYLPQDFEQPIQVRKTRFDVVWCHDAFQYVLDPFRTLRQWRDIAVQGGMLAIMVRQTTTFELNRETVWQPSLCYWHWTLINLMYVLAVSGWDCSSGFFRKQTDSPWLCVLAYRGSVEPQDPRRTSWYDLCDLGLLPDSAVKSIQKQGYLRQQDLVLPWIDKSLTWLGRP